MNFHQPTKNPQRKKALVDKLGGIAKRHSLMLIGGNLLEAHLGNRGKSTAFGIDAFVAATLNPKYADVSFGQPDVVC